MHTSAYVAELRSMGGHWIGAWGDIIASRNIPQDVLAGLTVAAVALPLNVALAIAAGLPATAGLIAGAVGGGIAAAFGGAPLQVTGPAAALNTLVLALFLEFGGREGDGTAAVAAAALVVGLVQIILGVATGGRFARYVPEALLAGFTTGVGLKLLDSQVPEFLGLPGTVDSISKMTHTPGWLHSVSWLAVVCGLGVAFLVVSTRHLKRFPAALVGVGIVTWLSMHLNWGVEDGIQKVGEISSQLPPLALPALDSEQWLDLAMRAIPLGLLASAESLLSARAVDRMAPTVRPHNPNLELLGQGLANVGVGLVSGMPVTGVVVRSGVNVQSGGKSRLAAIVHAGALLFAVVKLADVISQVPLAGLAGVLCVVGFRLIEVHTLRELWREEKVGAIAFVVTAAGTVSGHLMTGLAAGMAIHWGAHFLNRKAHEEQKLSQERRKQGIRAVLATHGEARRPSPYEAPPESHTWLRHISDRVQAARTAFIHPQSAVIGKVLLGEHVHIAAGSSVRADEGAPFFIGSNSNVQDGVVIHALKEKKVVVSGEEWAVYVGQNVSMAHDALIHGPCYIGDDTFIGFKAVVHDSIVGSRCFVGIGAVVVGVEIPDGKFVPHGSIVSTADDVARLPNVSETQLEFNEDVVDVNRGLARAYHQLNGTAHSPHTMSGAAVHRAHLAPHLGSSHPALSFRSHVRAAPPVARRRAVDERF